MFSYVALISCGFGDIILGAFFGQPPPDSVLEVLCCDSLDCPGPAVSFAPFLEDLSRKLGQQYLLTFDAKPEKSRFAVGAGENRSAQC